MINWPQSPFIVHCSYLEDVVMIGVCVSTEIRRCRSGFGWDSSCSSLSRIFPILVSQILSNLVSRISCCLRIGGWSWRDWCWSSWWWGATAFLSASLTWLAGTSSINYAGLRNRNLFPVAPFPVQVRLSFFGYNADYSY